MKERKIRTITCIVLIMVLLCSFSGCGLSAYKTPKYAQVYVTTGTMSKLLFRDTSLEFTEYDDSSFHTSVIVNTDESYQNYYGCGAALTHSAAHLLMQEGAESIRAEMLEQFFGASGARFSFIRVPIGASDYVVDSFFSCCDLEDNYNEDLTLSSFNVEKDADIIAVLKEIIAINPTINIVAVPWSAPAWMKTSHSLLGGSIDSIYNGVYADYLIKFVDAYAAEGINISYLSLANEPYISNIAYPHMQMDGLQAAEITKLLGKKLADKKMDVKIMTWDHNAGADSELWLEEVYGDEEASKYISGAAFHGYTQDEYYNTISACDYSVENYPNKEIYVTEITEHTGSNDFARNLSYAAQWTTIGPLNSGCSASLFWNLVLRGDGSPTPVKHGSECYGVMDMDVTEDRFTYYKHSSYYAMAHISQFAYDIDGKCPQVLRVESSNETQILASALYRADGTIIVVVVNLSDQLEENVDIVINGQSITYTILPQSVVTFVC